MPLAIRHQPLRDGQNPPKPEIRLGRADCTRGDFERAQTTPTVTSLGDAPDVQGGTDHGRRAPEEAGTPAGHAQCTSLTIQSQDVHVSRTADVDGAIHQDWRRLHPHVAAISTSHRISPVWASGATTPAFRPADLTLMLILC